MKSNQPIKLLLIEDEAYDVQRIRNTLKPFAARIEIVDVVSDGREAVELLRDNPNRYDVVVMDFQIPGGLIGENLIRRLKQIDETLQIIVSTKMTMNISDFEFANNLLEAGAIWYCTKYPGDIEDYIYQPTDFVLNIFNAYEKRKLLRAQRISSKKLDKNVQELLGRKRIIGQSPAMKELRAQIELSSASDLNVLVLGPSGTGKELVATNIHYQSSRKFESLVPINCGSLPDHLVESELFGFEKGSFTGASTPKKGLFEVAEGGTIFLDEIAELSRSAQAKLLRVMQDGEIAKIGRTETVQVNVRVIAATNKNLQEEVQEGNFRQDLFFRLNVVTLWVPPLTHRREDVPLLVEHFLEIFSQQMNVPVPEMPEAAMTLLRHYDWPGNVRELQNVIQRLLFTRAETITTRHVTDALGWQPPPNGQAAIATPLLWDKNRIIPWREMEQILQEKYFRFVRDNSTSDAEAARRLGLAPPNYHRMCKSLGIK